MPKARKKTTQKRSKAAADKCQLITNELLALLEQKTLPWRRPWQKTAYQNAISGHVYRGMNPLIAQISVIARDYDTTLFAGFNQAKDAGWQMKKGSKATYIRAAGQAVKTEEDKDGEEVEKRIRFVKWLPVFNLNCFTDSEDSKLRIADVVAQYTGEPNTAPRVDAVESFFAAQKANVSFGGDRAFYSPSSDRIQLPAYELFSSAEAYYATLAHELTHWTGHESRLSRDLKNSFGTADYAFEELVAEIGAAIVCGHLDLAPQLENHASYLQGWQKLLSGDKQAFFRAASLAQNAADLLLDNAGLLPEEID